MIGALVYARGVGTNPPGFYLDEASIAYNAWQIATTGSDEHGVRWPLYFRAFGEYKNPLYIYGLAAVYRVTGPSAHAARWFSAVIGAIGVAVIGIAATRISRRLDVGVVVWLLALTTPWLFALSRVVVEVAMYPLAVALFVLAVHRASVRPQWRWTDCASIALTLAILTYAYSIGRLLGPLLAGGLVLLIDRRRVMELATAWAMYAALLMPLAVFSWRHPGALSERFNLVSYVGGVISLVDAAQQFLAHYFANLNLWAFARYGDPNLQQIASVNGVGLMSWSLVVMSVAGVIVALVRMRHDPWLRYVLYACAVCVVPASLTTDDRHMLRLAALPVFLIVLTIPAITGILTSRRRTLALVATTAIVVVSLGEGAAYARTFAARIDDPHRRHMFDADYPETIFATALRNAGSPPRILIADAPSVPGYMQAFWNATQHALPRDMFERVPFDKGAPDGALVITTEKLCLRCQILAALPPYTVYRAVGPPREYPALIPSDHQAELSVDTPVDQLTPRQQITLSVRVRNLGHATWLAGERTFSPHQLAVANHWLDADGRIAVNDDGRAPMVTDVPPGETVSTTLIVNAPPRRGHYLLEIDIVQEGVKWFGETGSRTVRIPMEVR